MARSEISSLRACITCVKNHLPRTPREVGRKRETVVYSLPNSPNGNKRNTRQLVGRNTILSMKGPQTLGNMGIFAFPSSHTKLFLPHEFILNNEK